MDYSQPSFALISRSTEYESAVGVTHGRETCCKKHNRSGLMFQRSLWFFINTDLFSSVLFSFAPFVGHPSSSPFLGTFSPFLPLGTCSVL